MASQKKKAKALGDSDTWTEPLLEAYLASAGDGSAPFFKNFFKWDDEKLKKACEYVVQQLQLQGLKTYKRLPSKGT